jgi:hypothetical protein
MKLKLLILILSLLPITAQVQKAVITYDSITDMVIKANPRNSAANVVEVVNVGLFRSIQSVSNTNRSSKIMSNTAGWSWLLMSQNQSNNTKTNHGSSASISIDPRIKVHRWSPTANCTFSIMTNMVTDATIDWTVFIEISVEDPWTVTNTVNTMTARGSWGNLSVGHNTIELNFQGSDQWTIYQDTGKISATLIDGVTGRTGSAKVVQSSGPKLDDYFDLEPSSEPDAPTSGVIRLFQTGDGTFKFKDSLGSVSSLSESDSSGVDFTASATTDATEVPTAIWSNGLGENNTLYLKCFIAAAGETNTGGYSFDALFRRESSSSLIGSNNVTEIETDADLNAYFALEGDDVKLYVRGITNETVRWVAKGFFMRGTNGVIESSLPSALVEEEFEDATDYDESGWTEIGNGTIDPNYTVAELDGDESLHITTDTAQARYIYKSFTATSDASAYCLFKPVAHPATVPLILGFFDNSSAIVASVMLLPGGALRVSQGGSTQTTVGTLVNGTTYHIWLDYSIDGTAAVRFSEDGLKPAGGDNVAEVVGGSATTDARYIFTGWVFSTDGINEGVWDNVYVDDEEIGSNP